MGDSSYVVRPFLIALCKNSKHGTPEDAFNYHSLSSYIFVECAFNEIDARQGIWLSPLRFSFRQNIKVIDAWFCWHSFIVCHYFDSERRNSNDKHIEFYD